MTSHRLLLLTALSLLLMIPAQAHAAPRRVLTEADGVSLGVRGKAQVLRFTSQKAYRERLAGRSAEIDCEDFSERGRRLLTSRQTSLHRRLPRRARTLRLGPLRGGRYDLCRVRVRERLSAAVGGTALGRRHLDELTTSGRLIQLQFAASEGLTVDAAVLLPADQVVARGRGAFVALEGPDAMPPPGKAGYWTDGGPRVVFAATTAAGRRLYVDGRTDGDDVTLNVLPLTRDQRDIDDSVALAESADRLRLI